MGSLRKIASTLPPGFRFHPTDGVLVWHYLYNKVAVADAGVSRGETLIDVDLHTCEPWDLPEAARLSDDEWYFFSKHATGSRTNRETELGYWKATGKERAVCSAATIAAAAMRKTLVFYRGRAPDGVKTGWVMHEFRLENPRQPTWEDWVLCRVFPEMKGETERAYYSVLGEGAADGAGGDGCGALLDVGEGAVAAVEGVAPLCCICPPGMVEIQRHACGNVRPAGRRRFYHP